MYTTQYIKAGLAAVRPNVKLGEKFCDFCLAYLQEVCSLVKGEPAQTCFLSLFNFCFTFFLCVETMFGVFLKTPFLHSLMRVTAVWGFSCLPMTVSDHPTQKRSGGHFDKTRGEWTGQLQPYNTAFTDAYTVLNLKAEPEVTTTIFIKKPFSYTSNNIYLLNNITFK